MAVMAVLLILTLFLPLMFSMSERAMYSAMKGSDELRSSYLARTMIEMCVAAFQDEYDNAEDELNDGRNHETDTTTSGYKLNQFYLKKAMVADTVYMFRDPDVEYPVQPDDDATDEEKAAWESAFDVYEQSGVVYVSQKNLANKDKTSYIYNRSYNITADIVDPNTGETKEKTGNFIFLGYADCEVNYDDSVEYYKTYMKNGAYTTELVVDDPDTADKVEGKDDYDSYIANPPSAQSNSPKYSRVEKRNVKFVSTAKFNNKVQSRTCVVVLPTKPDKQNWIVPANLESHQIFVDSKKASSITNIALPDSFFVDSAAVKNQPVYIYSCIGNMVLSTDNLNIALDKDANGNATSYASYKELVYASNNNTGASINVFDANGNKTGTRTYSDIAKTLTDDANATLPPMKDYSLGVHPETTTVKPEKDPNFACIKTNNMRSWANSAQHDNFVAFTATNGIEVDMKVNLIMNPCRTGRIGDGISANQSLYKIMYFQAPNIVFKNEVNSFVSLYQKTSIIATLLDYNAYRMSSIMLAAPESSPHSYYHSHKNYNRTVKAGKVYFMDDVYVWLVPFTEDGSNYRTQTVYYKGKDIILYKFANAGDVYLFNNEVETNGEKAGFSMTGYFMDVLYNKDQVRTDNLKWYNFWSQIQNWIFNGSMEAFRDTTYVEEDLKYIGNIGTGGAEAVPDVDDLYVVWDS